MAIIYKINNIDQTKYVEKPFIESNIAHAPDTYSFHMEIDPGGGNEPFEGQDVTVQITGGDKIFSGIITKKTKQIISFPSLAYSYDIECTDYQRLLDRRLVPESYSSKTSKFIIEDIVAKYTSGFTTVNVQAGETMTKTNFNYKKVSECIRLLAQEIGYAWYVDYDKDIHFFAQETSWTPHDITDANLGTIINSYRVQPDTANVKNRVYVRGSYYLGANYTQSDDADGIQREWNLEYKAHEITMTEGGAAKTIGIEYLNDEALFDYMFNYAEKTIRCSVGTATPAAGVAVVFIYKPEIAVIVQMDDTDSQTSLAALEGGDGIYEDLIEERDYDTREEARDRGYAELNTFAEPLIRGSFTTYTDGWRAGQTINVDVVSDPTYNGKYTIQRVAIIPSNVDHNIYNVEFSQRLYRLEEFFRSIAERAYRRRHIDEQEVIDRVFGFAEAVTIGEVVATDLRVLAADPFVYGVAEYGLSAFS